MKKLLTLLFALTTLFVYGQDTAPDSTAVRLNSPSFYYSPGDSALSIYKSYVYGWTKLAPQRNVDNLAAWAGTVKSVGITVPTGLSVSGSPVTVSGVIGIGLASGYSIPSTSDQSTWTSKEPAIATGSTSQFWRGDKSWQALNPVYVGLANVDNTSDVNKPVSTAQQSALNLKANIASPTFTGTVAGINATMVGLANVTNNAQWYSGNHPTTLSGYGITDTPWTGMNYLISGGALGTPYSGTLTNCTFPTLNQSTTGTAANITATSNTTLTALANLTTIGTLTIGSIPYSLLSGSIPIWNQNTTGSAATLTTARTIAGTSFNGSANITLANKYIVGGTSDAGLTGSQFLGALTTGILKNATTTGLLTIATGGDLPVMTATVGGAVPTPPNNTTAFLRGDGTFAIPPSGTGTVTSTSITAANGISGTVATATTTPAITLSLGAITPTSTNGVSAATMAYLDATSSVQTQLNNKVATNGALGTPSSGTLTNCTFPTLNQSTAGTAANITGTSNSTLTSLPNLISHGTLTSLAVTGTTNYPATFKGSSGGGLIFGDGFGTSPASGGIWAALNSSGSAITPSATNYSLRVLPIGELTLNVPASSYGITCASGGVSWAGMTNLGGWYFGKNLYNGDSNTTLPMGDVVIENDLGIGLGLVGAAGTAPVVPTANLHIGAGVATSGGAPLKINSGPLLTTTEAGTIENNGSHLYYTPVAAGTRYQLDQQSGGSGTVSSVSVTTANGISGTVATATTTPAITLSLGAITPTSTNGVSAATMAYLDATSSVQTQLNGKQASLGFTPYNSTNPSSYIPLTALSGTLPIIYTNTTGVFSHSFADGYLHVPATSTTNNGKFLTAGSTAGSLSWTTPYITSLTTTGSGAATVSSGVLNIPTPSAGTGTVTSVGLTMPTGFTVTGSPVTGSGTLAADLTAGYYLPTITDKSNWGLYNQWSGTSVGLTAATGRTSLGATTVGANLFTAANPSAITFPKINADNSVTFESAASHLTSQGATTIGANLFTSTNPSAISYPQVSATNTVSYLSGSSLLSAIGGVSSIGMTTPTGLTVTGSPITSSGTLALSLTSGYVIPTTVQVANFATAYADALQWNGGSANLVPATGLTSLGGTTVGQSMFTLANPSAISFPEISATNLVSAKSATQLKTDLGIGTGSSGVTMCCSEVVGTSALVSLATTGAITTTGTKALIMFSGALHVISSNTGGTWYIYMDGVLKYTYILSNVYSSNVPLSFQTMLFSLTPGSHTFQAEWNAPSGLGINYQSLSVVDLQ